MKKTLFFLVVFSTFLFSSSSLFVLGWNVTKSVTAPIVYSIEAFTVIQDSIEQYKIEKEIKSIEKENCSLKERYENEYVMNCVKQNKNLLFQE